MVTFVRYVYFTSVRGSSLGSHVYVVASHKAWQMLINYTLTVGDFSDVISLVLYHT